jgi:hypothetical protein
LCDTDELPQLDIANRIDCDAAEKAELSDEGPGRLQVPEGPVAGQPPPAANDTEASAANPVAPHIDDEFVFAAGDDECPEHLSAIFETRTQV